MYTSQYSTRKSRIIRVVVIPVVTLAIVSIIFVSNILGGMSSLKVSAQDLMQNIRPAKVSSIKVNNQFIKASADFSIDLIKKSLTKGSNSLVSPLSVYLALAMTANGADGKTLKEFETLLGENNISINDINKYCYSLSNKLKDVKSGKLNIANSIWYRQDNSLQVKESFLQTNADYFGANAYKADFNSNKTVNDINNWVKYNTGNLIDKIIDGISPDNAMYLLNTIYFDGEWQEKYTTDEIQTGNFNAYNGERATAEFMNSTESLYLKDDNAQGFIKPYKDNKFSFVALLPDIGVNIDSYVASLTGEKFLSLINNKTNISVTVKIPKFKSDYTKDLVEPLKEMGLNDCFRESANLSKMGTSDNGNLFVGDILHETFIQVDEAGTKAGAVTAVEIDTKSCMEIGPKEVLLDRPFVYAIVDNETSLPLFIGTMNDPR
jgi:serine protease inhibitor